MIHGLQQGLTKLAMGLGPISDAPEGWDGDIDTLTPAFLATTISRPEPTWWYHFNEASGATERIVGGSGDMSDVGSPSKQENSANLGGLVTKWTTTNDAMVSSNTSTGNPGGNDLVVMYIGYCPLPDSGNYHEWAEHWDRGATATGWSTWVNTGNRRQAWSTANTTGSTEHLILSSVAQYDVPGVWLFTAKIGTVNSQRIWIPGGGSAQTTPVTGSIDDSGVPMRVGKAVSPSVTNQEHGHLFIWQDADAEDASSWNNTERLALAEALSYE